MDCLFDGFLWKTKCSNLREQDETQGRSSLRWKLTSEYDQMRLTTITTCNNCNKVSLTISKIYNLKLINSAITGKGLPK